MWYKYNTVIQLQPIKWHDNNNNNATRICQHMNTDHITNPPESDITTDHGPKNNRKKCTNNLNTNPISEGPKIQTTYLYIAYESHHMHVGTHKLYI